MSIKVTFEAHSTSVDNETGTASGHHDCPLSALGREQARELGRRYRGCRLNGVYCSDLRRSWETAEIAFGKGPDIRRDFRLRECDYGSHARRPSSSIRAEAPSRVREPFPGGESYDEASQRIRLVLLEIARDHEGGHVLVVGHRATQYALEQWLNGIPLLTAITASWSWQPGWHYELEGAASLDSPRADDRT
ncbi:MAG TPA: histidine phosphatase family protein [Solirubrobacterales bacterium]|nr:histidine phosphatase family protein [Solirubrobacterales bacterium]